MCGRYLITMEEEIMEMREIMDEINERYKDSPELAASKTGEIFPTQTAPVLTAGADKPQAALMTWGFPKWQGSGVIINACAETAPEKKTFRSSLFTHRCVVPTTGFFEWRQEDCAKKTKYLFRLPGTKMLYLAGFFNRFTDAHSAYDAYVILTTAANPSVSPYHHRMPLVLTPDAIGGWLNDTSFALAQAAQPCGAMLAAAAV